MKYKMAAEAWQDIRVSYSKGANLTVEFTSPYETEDGQEIMACVDDLKIVGTGLDKTEAFGELLISLGVLLAYNSGISSADLREAIGYISAEYSKTRKDENKE